MKKTIQDLKKEIETTKKSKRETTVEIVNLGKEQGTVPSIINRTQEIEERISGVDATIENTDRTIKEYAACIKLLT